MNEDDFLAPDKKQALVSKWENISKEEQFVIDRNMVCAKKVGDQMELGIRVTCLYMEAQQACQTCGPLA